MRGRNCGRLVKMHSQHVYEIRPRKDKRGVDLVSDVLPFGRLWYAVASPQTAFMSAIAAEQQKMRS